MSLGPEPQANFPLGIVILILCFIRGVLVNSYLAFPNIKCLNCIDFVLRTLEHLEIIIMLIIPSFISFVAYKQAKGKYFFIHIQTLVLMFFIFIIVIMFILVIMLFFYSYYVFSQLFTDK